MRDRTTPPDADAVSGEIEALRNVKSNVREATAFGDNNHDAIDAQIEVLEERLTYDDIHNRWGEEAAEEDKSEYVLNEALSARQWLDGDGGSLAGEWQELSK